MKRFHVLFRDSTTIVIVCDEFVVGENVVTFDNKPKGDQPRELVAVVAVEAFNAIVEQTAAGEDEKGARALMQIN